jgi:preprotein translocase subunit YajC
LDLREIFGVLAPLLDVYPPVSEAVVSEAVEAASEAGGTSILPTLLIYGVFAAVMIFMFIQPRRQQKAKAAMLKSLKVGDGVMTASGFYGTIVDVSDDHFVLEFGGNRGVRIPVRKEAVDGVGEPGGK